MYDDFQEKELKYYIFINLEKFNLLNTKEKYNSLIENKVLVKKGKTTPMFQCVYDSVPYNYSKMEFVFDDLYDFNGNDYEINIEIKEEFFNYLKVRVEELYTDPYFTIKELEHKSQFLSLTEKVDFFTERFKKTSKILARDVAYKLFLGESFQGFNNWKDYIIEVFNDDLFQYLTTAKYIKSEIVEEWCNLFEAKTLMDFCKKQLDLLESQNSSTNNQQKETKEHIAYYSNIFNNQSAEKMVFNVLNDVGVLNKHNKAIKKGFQSPCYDIWSKLTIAEKYHIFKKSATLKNFILFLNAKFDAKIKSVTNLTNSDFYTNSVRKQIAHYINQAKSKLTE